MLVPLVKDDTRKMKAGNISNTAPSMCDMVPWGSHMWHLQQGLGQGFKCSPQGLSVWSSELQTGATPFIHSFIHFLKFIHHWSIKITTSKQLTKKPGPPSHWTFLPTWNMSSNCNIASCLHGWRTERSVWACVETSLLCRSLPWLRCNPSGAVHSAFWAQLYGTPFLLRPDSFHLCWLSSAYWKLFIPEVWIFSLILQF